MNRSITVINYLMLVGVLSGSDSYLLSAALLTILITAVGAFATQFKLIYFFWTEATFFSNLLCIATAYIPDQSFHFYWNSRCSFNIDISLLLSVPPWHMSWSENMVHSKQTVVTKSDSTLKGSKKLKTGFLNKLNSFSVCRYLRFSNTALISGDIW